MTLTSRVRGSYCKLPVAFFSTSAYGPGTKQKGHEVKRKKKRCLTYSTDRENEVSKMVIISLGN